jgi:hypothetical protein
MKTYTIKIALDANEETEVKRLALQDGVSIEEELRILLRLQIREEIELRELEDRNE